MHLSRKNAFLSINLNANAEQYMGMFLYSCRGHKYSKYKTTQQQSN